MQVVDTIELRADRTIDILDFGLAYYNDQGNHFRVFHSKEDALIWLDTNDEKLVMRDFDEEEELDLFLEEIEGLHKIKDKYTKKRKT